jgi:hypothetical protein
MTNPQSNPSDDEYENVRQDSEQAQATTEDLPDESGAIGPNPPAGTLDDLAEGKYQGKNADLRRAMAVDAED